MLRFAQCAHLQLLWIFLLAHQERVWLPSQIKWLQERQVWGQGGPSNQSLGWDVRAARRWCISGTIQSAQTVFGFVCLGLGSHVPTALSVIMHRGDTWRQAWIAARASRMSLSSGTCLS
jgi:hypothetical protein